MKSFEDKLAFGKVAESKISQWLVDHGSIVLPAGDIKCETYKGPRMSAAEGDLISPDLVMVKDAQVSWIEAKHKNVFSWHRMTRRWTTGIDRYYYKHYIDIANKTEMPVYLLFLHSQATPTPSDVIHGCPPRSPTGLYGNTIRELRGCENHRHDNWGKGGMVYWAHESLTLLATMDDINKM